jgi:hypothetical protein
MSPIIQNWRLDLIEAHPGLFHPPEGHPEKAAGYPWCEQGWRDLLERLFVRIEDALRQGETIHFTRIKEKFAGLRVYWRGDVSPETAAGINEAIALAEARSACTCEECGEEGRPYKSGGWLMTRCAAHARGAAVQGRPGFEYIRIVRPVGSRLRAVASRRYDRAADAFIAVDAGFLGIEEE